jgi:uncharacterized membrane protein affecting hemolysin expression
MDQSMTAKQVIEDQGGWKGIGIKWLFNQSVPVILLFVIIGVLVWKLDPFLAGKSKERDDFASMLSEQRTEFRTDIKEMMSDRIQSQERLTAALQEMTHTLRDMQSRLQNNPNGVDN